MPHPPPESPGLGTPPGLGGHRGPANEWDRSPASRLSPGTTGVPPTSGVSRGSGSWLSPTTAGVPHPSWRPGTPLPISAGWPLGPHPSRDGPGTRHLAGPGGRRGPVPSKTAPGALPSAGKAGGPNPPGPLWVLLGTRPLPGEPGSPSPSSDQRLRDGGQPYRLGGLESHHLIRPRWHLEHQPPPGSPVVQLPGLSPQLWGPALTVGLESRPPA